MRFKFSRDEVYETEGPKKGHKFLKDQEFNFEPNFAERWARRGAGEVTDPRLEGGVGRDGPFEPLGEKPAKAAQAKRPAKALNAEKLVKVMTPGYLTPPPADQTFKAGDIVILRSGSPELTVTGLTEQGDVNVTWKGEDGSDVADTYPAASLTLFLAPQA